MESNQNLQKQSKNIFMKVYNFFRIIFKRKKVNSISNVENSKQKEYKNDFRKNIEIKEDKSNVVTLKQQFDNKMIDVKEISIKEKVELLKIYKQEILEYKNMQQKLGKL